MSDTAPIILADVRARQTLAESLARSKEGTILGTVANLLAILRHDPALAGLITYNEFTYEAALLRPPPLPDDAARPMPGPYPRQWTEGDEALILAYVQRAWTSRATDGALRSAMAAEAPMRGCHPVMEYLASLKWDRKPRLDQWLQTAFGAEDVQYTRDVGSKTLIAAVRRVCQPGCKFDFMLILEGKQGIGKSTAIKALFSEEWFSDSIIPDLADKDAAINLVGKWCLEMAEISHFNRNETETLKAFISRATDKYRPPFGRTDVSRPRQGIIIGTTNQDKYLRDETGNRRFWPAQCTRADSSWITTNRDQLWAEAAEREALNETIWLDDAETQADATTIQASRLEQDAWHDRIAIFLTLKTDTTTAEILESAVSMPVKDHNRAAQMRTAAVLVALGWTQDVVRKGARIVRVWKSPKT